MCVMRMYLYNLALHIRSIRSSLVKYVDDDNN